MQFNSIPRRCCIVSLLLLVLLCWTVDLSSAVVVLVPASAAPPCPSVAVACLYVAPSTYTGRGANTSHPLGSSDNPYTSLSVAITNANVSPTATTYLVLYAGKYSGTKNNNLNTLGKNLVLVSYDFFSNTKTMAAATPLTYIDGGAVYSEGGSRCLTVSQGSSTSAPVVTIIAMTIQNCMGTYGAAISVNSGCTLNLNGTAFIDNSVTASGGALFGTFATINIANSRFVVNVATYNGGGVFFLGCNVAISDTVFDFCFAENGAAGYFEGGSFSLSGGYIYLNNAFNTGGGFALTAVQTTITNSQFIENIGGGGNALEINSSPLLCTNTIFHLGSGTNENGQVHLINQAVAFPGVDNYFINCTFSDSQGLRFSGVSMEDTNNGPSTPTTYFIDVTFSGNSANGDAGVTGGALHGSNSAYNCSGCVFSNNYGAQLGAAAVCENGAYCVFENTVFEENHSWAGAAVYIAASNTGPSNTNPTSSAYLTNCSFIGNSLLRSFKFGQFTTYAPAGMLMMGGAVFVGAQSKLYFVGGQMINNSAEYGGAIYVDTYFNSIELSDLTLENNHATVHGGAIYLANFPSFSNVSIEPNITLLTVVNNVAVNGGGGGIFVAQGIANYNPALYGAEVLHNSSQVCAFCSYAGNSAPYGSDLATDPFKLNIQVADQPLSLPAADSLHSLDSASDGAQASAFGSGSTIYVSAVLVDFFDQQVSVATGQQVQVAVKNGIISNLIMTGASASAAAAAASNQNGTSSSSANILLAGGEVTFSLSLLSYPSSQASISVSVPQITGLAAAGMSLAIRPCSVDEFVEGVNGNTDLAVCSMIASMPSSGKAAALAVVAVSYLVLAFFFIYFTTFRKHRVVYQSSIVFCMLILLGLALINTAALLSALDKTVNTCTARIFLLHSGFAFAIGSISIKLLRLRLIFNNPLLVMLKLSDKVMLWRLLVVFLLNMAPVIVWAVVDPFQSSGLNVDSCSSSNSEVYELTLLCFNGFVLFSSAYFAFSLRNSPSQYNETTALALLNYLVLVLGIVWVVLRWSGNLSATGLSLAESFLLACAAMFTSCILFGPKVYVLTRALIRKAARQASQRKIAGGARRTWCSCWMLMLSGARMSPSDGTSNRTSKPLAERADSDHHSVNASRAGTTGLLLDLEELDDDLRNPNEKSAAVLDKIESLKGRLHSRVGTLKHNVRQVALAEKDVTEIIALLGAACSEYQFLQAHGVSVPGRDPLDLVNDPLFTDAAHAISRVHGFYSTDSGGESTGNGSAQAQRNERRAFTKSPGPSARRSQMLAAAATPTNGPTLSARKHGTGSASGVAGTMSTVHSPTTMPSKFSLPLNTDTTVEHFALALGRLPASSSVALSDGEGNVTGRGDDTNRSSASTASSGSDSSRRHNGSGIGNDIGGGHHQIELEQLTLQR